MRALTMTGRSDSVSAPTVQNQLVAERADPLPVVGAHFADHVAVEAKHVRADLEARRADPGRRNEARRAVAGERDDHELRDDADAPSGRRAAAKPPTMRPQMIAAKVAPSTSALPETSSSRFR